MTHLERSNIPELPEIMAQEAGRLAADALLQVEDPAAREEIIDELQEELADAGVVVVDIRANDDEAAPARTGVRTGRTREAVIAAKQTQSKLRRRTAARHIALLRHVTS